MILFRTPTDVSEQALPELRLAHVQASSSVAARLSTEGRAEIGCFATVELTRADPQLIPFFLDALQPITDQLPGDTTAAELFPLLGKVQELFRSLSDDPRTTAMGLWGELLTMAQTKSPEGLLRAWHNDPMDPVDFISGAVWIEVKTTASERRRHHVTARQVSPPGGSRGLLVSILTMPSATGPSIRELVHRLEGSLTPAMRSKLNEIVVKQLGRDAASGLEARFDEAVARSTLRVYDMRSLPTLATPFPPEISEVRYLLDLTALPAAGESLDSLAGTLV